MSDLSPDMEASQEFTTADFYIDESMPSSIDSPPKPCSENKTSLEETLAAEKQANARLLEDLHTCNKKLCDNEHKMKQLHSLVCDNLPFLKQTASELKESQLKYIESVLSEIESVRVSLVGCVEKVVSNMETEETAVIDKLKAEHETETTELKDKLETKSAKISELENSLLIEQNDRKAAESELKGEVERLRQEQGEVGAQLAEQVKELTLKHELELEVEIDKAREELVVRIATLERELEAQARVVSERDAALAAALADRARCEEEMTARFQKEKEAICGILGAEHDEKLEQVVQEQQQKLDTMHQSVVAEMRQAHQAEMEKQVDMLKQSFTVEKQQALEMTQSTLTLEHTKQFDDIRDQMLKEKETEIDQLRKELESKHKKAVDKLTLGFNSQREKLESELKQFTSKDFSTCETQSDLCSFNNLSCESQTEAVPVLETHMQTEVLAVSSATMQTDVKGQADNSMQTDAKVHTDNTMQTSACDEAMCGMPDEEVSSGSVHGRTRSEGPVAGVCCGVQTEAGTEVVDGNTSQELSALRELLQADFDKVCEYR